MCVRLCLCLYLVSPLSLYYSLLSIKCSQTKKMACVCVCVCVRKRVCVCVLMFVCVNALTRVHRSPVSRVLSLYLCLYSFAGSLSLPGPLACRLPASEGLSSPPAPSTRKRSWPHLESQPQPRPLRSHSHPESRNHPRTQAEGCKGKVVTSDVISLPVSLSAAAAVVSASFPLPPLLLIPSLSGPICVCSRPCRRRQRRHGGRELDHNSPGACEESVECLAALRRDEDRCLLHDFTRLNQRCRDK